MLKSNARDRVTLLYVSEMSSDALALVHQQVVDMMDVERVE
jgi:hypothetical protein